MNMTKCPECGNPIYIRKFLTDKERDSAMKWLEEVIKKLKEEHDKLWYEKFGK